MRKPAADLSGSKVAQTVSRRKLRGKRSLRSLPDGEPLGRITKVDQGTLKRIVCRKKRLSNAPRKMREKAKRPLRKPANLFAKRFITSEKENTALVRPSRRSRSDCPKRAVLA